MTSIEAGFLLPGSGPLPLSRRVEHSPQYVRVEQQPSLCGPASLQMIFNRRGNTVDQIQIAQSLGTKVPAERAGQYTAVLPIAEDPSKAGTDLDVFVSKKMRRVAKQHGLLLQSSKYHIEEIPDLPDFLSENLSLGNDILVNFIDDLNKAKTGMGHYALVSAVENKTAELCDPWPGNDAFYPVNTDALAERIDTVDALGNRRGIVVFEGKIQTLS